MAVPGKIRQSGVDGGGSKWGGGGGEWGRQGDRQFIEGGKVGGKEAQTRWKAAMSAFCFLSFGCLDVQIIVFVKMLLFTVTSLCVCVHISVQLCVWKCTWCSKRKEEKVWTPLPQYLHVYVRLTSLSPNLGKIGHCGISISEKLKLETKGFLSGERSPGLSASSPSSDSSK